VTRDKESAGSTAQVEAVYGTLTARISDNFDLQWRGPTFALAAQSFLFGGFLGAMKYPWLQMLLALLIAQAGIAAALLMLHVSSLIDLDCRLLDRYEEILIPERPQLRLHNAARGRTRYAAVVGPDWNPPWIFSWIVRVDTRPFSG
jgi:hypothetical protein